MKVILTLFVIAFMAHSVLAEHSWYYAFVSVDTQNSQPDLIACDLKAVKIKRGDYAVNGTLEIKRDVGTKFKFNMKTFRSPRGNDDYKPMPWSIDKQDFSEFFNGFYKRALMADLGKCSSAPFFEDEWDGLIKKGVLKFDMCKIDTKEWPEDLMDGYYKLIMDLNDENDEPVGTIEVIVQVEQKS